MGGVRLFSLVAFSLTQTRPFELEEISALIDNFGPIESYVSIYDAIDFSDVVVFDFGQ